MSDRESMEYDVVIVGAGPAGLSAAIRLKQLAEAEGRELSVCVLEKGSEVGAHILSGAVVDPIALNELIPNWKELDSPLSVPVTDNQHWVLSKNGKWAMPHLMMPLLVSFDSLGDSGDRVSKSSSPPANRSSTRSRTPSAVAPSSSASGRSWIRCRSVGPASVLTSSGVT